MFYGRGVSNQSIELGEQPLDISNRDLLNEDFDLGALQPGEQALTHPESPPMLTSKGSALGASKSSHHSKVSNYKGSPKNFSQNQDLKLMVQHEEKAHFAHGHGQDSHAQALVSPKDAKHPPAKGKGDVEKAID